MLKPTFTTLLPTSTLGLATAGAHRNTLLPTTEWSEVPINDNVPAQLLSSAASRTPVSLLSAPENRTQDRTPAYAAHLGLSALFASAPNTDSLSTVLWALSTTAKSPWEWFIVGLAFMVPLLRVPGRAMRNVIHNLLANSSSALNLDELSELVHASIEDKPVSSIFPHSPSIPCIETPSQTSSIPLRQTPAITAIEWANFQAGRFDRTMHPVREPLALIGGAINLFLLDAGAFGPGPTVAAMAFGLYCIFSYGNTANHLLLSQASTNSVLTREGTQRQLAILRGVAPPIEPNFSESDVFSWERGLEYADYHGPLDKWIEGKLGRDHRLYTIMALLGMNRAVRSLNNRHKVYSTAKRQKAADRKYSRGELLLPERKFMAEAKIHFPRFAINLFHTLRTSIEFKKNHRLPRHMLTTAIAGPHTGLFDNFGLGWLRDPLERQIADKGSFYEQLEDLGKALARNGFLFADRDSDTGHNHQSEELPQRTSLLAKKYGLQYTYYFNGQRVGEASDDGVTTSHMPSLYTTGKANNPARFSRMGPFVEAVTKAEIAQEPVALLINVIHGGYVMPKRAKNIVDVNVGSIRRQHITIEEADYIIIDPPKTEEEKNRRIQEVHDQAVAIFRKAYGLDAHLIHVVGQWLGSEAAEKFMQATEARGDENNVPLFALVDYIREIPGFLEERQEFINRLKTFIDTDFPEEELQQTLKDVYQIATLASYATNKRQFLKAALNQLIKPAVDAEVTQLKASHFFQQQDRNDQKRLSKAIRKKWSHSVNLAFKQYPELYELTEILRHQSPDKRDPIIEQLVDLLTPIQRGVISNLKRKLKLNNVRNKLTQADIIRLQEELVS